MTLVHLDDLDAPATCHATSAVDNLAAVHQLPPYVKAYATRSGVHIAVTPETAEPWRAALGAPLFQREQLEHYSRFKTEHLWFGILVRLSYADY